MSHWSSRQPSPGASPVDLSKTHGARPAATVEPELANLWRFPPPVTPQVGYVQDPVAYRPATPILNWRGPARSTEPPLVPLWVAITALVVAEALLVALVPPQLDSDHRTVFTAVVISAMSFGMAVLMYLSMTRHLHNLAALMDSINTPHDMDLVLERLQQGRFSRFEETWKVQVHIIFLFCRLLRNHHNVLQHAPRAESFPHRRQPPVHSRVSPNGAADDRGRVVAGGIALGARAGAGDYGTAGSTDDDGLHSAASAPEVATSADVDDGPPVVVMVPADPPAFPAAVADVLVLAQPPFEAKRRRSTRQCASAAEFAPLMSDPLSDNARPWEEVMACGASEEGGRGLMLQLMKQVSIGQDLSKIALPVNILEPRSLLEKLSDLFVHPTLMGAIAAPRVAPLERMIRVCRWFLSGYHVRPVGVRKPYNPILGETFECIFGSEGNGVHYVAEQVSHHPPISVFHARHTGTGVTVTTSFLPRSRLATPNTGASLVEGFGDLTVPGEDAAAPQVYRFTWPSVYVSGLLSGPMRMELGGTVHIDCAETKLSARIEFCRKPYIGGDYDVIEGGVGPTRANGKSYVASEALVTFSGKWAGVTMQHRGPKGSRTSETLFDATAVMPPRPAAPPTNYPRPSRATWIDVTRALRQGDAAAAQQAKHALESSEREARRRREARGEQYVPALFRIVGEHKAHGKDAWMFVPPKLPPPVVAGATAAADSNNVT